MKHEVHLKPKNGGPFNCIPGRAVEIEDEEIVCNDVVLPWENHVHNMRAWVIGNEFGVCGMVWADCEQDAFDELCDQGLSDGLSAADEPGEGPDEREGFSPLGNFGKIHDLTYAWIQNVDWKPERDFRLLAALAEARGAGWDRIGG